MKYHITSITSVLQDFAVFFNIISFLHVLHFGVCRSQIEWNMKVKGQILICTAIMLNDHSNPYIESTTVLSDTVPSPTSSTCTLLSVSLSVVYAARKTCSTACNVAFVTAVVFSSARAIFHA